MIIVTIQDIRDAGYCSRGARDWARHNGFDFRDFLINGMPIERMESIDDPFCAAVAQHVRAKRGVGDG